MPEASVALQVSDQQNRIGPDLFGFYTREIVDLLSQDENFMVSSSTTKKPVSISSKSVENGKETVDSHASSLFSSSIEDAIPDVNRELLKASLRQSVRALTNEVDEMLDPVIRTRQIISCLRLKKQHYDRETPPDGDPKSLSCKKLRTSSLDAKRDLFAGHNREADKETGEVNDDLRFLLESENSLLLEETMAKHSDELDVMLNHMQQQLEELLDAIVTKCRLMTRQEKQQLRQLIQKLPPRNLERIVEIIQRGGKSSDTLSSGEILVDLEDQENVTLWRLYFYVKAVENAQKLSA